MKREKFKKMSLNLTTNQNDYMSSFKHNIDMYIAEPDFTIRELSERSNIPFSTLNSFLYGDSKDCKLSTAIALARALEVSIDELVGAGTISEVTRKNIATCRNLPENAKHLIRWYIEHQKKIYDDHPRANVIVSVMEPTCSGNGNMKPQDISKYIDISSLEPDIRSKVFFGFKIPCDHYMPYYSPYDILLVANDRNANHNEHVVVFNDGCIYITQRKIVDGEPQFFGIRDNRFKRKEKDVDEVIGYVAYTIKTPIEIFE